MVAIELYRVRCPDCGIRTERVEQLPTKAPFSKRFEDEVGQASEGASACQVARRFRLAANTVRPIDFRWYLERWQAKRRRPALRQMGVDKILVCGSVTDIWAGNDGSNSGEQSGNG